MRTYLPFYLFALLSLSGPAVAEEPIEGTYSTVTESECNFSITFLKNGKGSFVEECRREDGSHKDDIEKKNITWSLSGNVITVFGVGSPFTLTIHNPLSCESFGESGSRFGLIGYGKNYFWKEPRVCK